tara:strand:+ start:542 stop:931 length:390 start_codon:yes stop_codon:yes gene_type:complete
MADGFKILAAKELFVSTTANTSDSFVYRVPRPSGQRHGTRIRSQAIISSIVVCHHGAGQNPTVTLRVVQDGFTTPVAFDDSQYVIFLDTLTTNQTKVYSLGIGLTADNAIYASSSLVDVNIHIFGTEAI